MFPFACGRVLRRPNYTSHSRGVLPELLQYSSRTNHNNTRAYLYPVCFGAVVHLSKAHDVLKQTLLPHRIASAAPQLNQISIFFFCFLLFDRMLVLPPPHRALTSPSALRRFSEAGSTCAPRTQETRPPGHPQMNPLFAPA